MQAATLLTWLSGSTVLVSLPEALWLAVLLAVALGLVLAGSRALTLLELGAELPQSLGLKVRAVQPGTLILAALMASAATMIIGPLSFVGLIAPHLARLFGTRLFARHVVATAFFGAIVMVASDFAGRVAMSPWQLPGGLVAGLFGSLGFILLAGRRRARAGAG